MDTDPQPAAPEAQDTPAPSAQARKSNAILSAAKRHFAAHGFEDTKLSAVAKDAGVAVGTIYLRYAGKAELLGGVLSSVELSFAEAMRAPEVWAVPFPERFSRIIAAVLSAAQRETELAALMALAPFAATPHSNDQGTPAPKSAILDGIEAHLRDGMDRGELRTDLAPELAARLAHGLVEGGMRSLMAQPEVPQDEVAQALVDASRRWLAL